jgi:hypothetical protein
MELEREGGSTVQDDNSYTGKKLCHVSSHERFLPDGCSWRGKVVVLSRLITHFLCTPCSKGVIKLKKKELQDLKK